MATARDNGFPGKFCPVHKEQQRDGGGGETFKKRNKTATGREEGGQQDNHDKGDGERVEYAKKFHKHS